MRSLIHLVAGASLAATLSFGNALAADPKNTLVMETKDGKVVIDLAVEEAPQHAERLKTLANQGFYDGLKFHRVIPGFMAQTGDPLGNGRGGSDLPDLPAEFSEVPYERGIVGMARASNPNSANSQFFIMFEPAPTLNGQYTVVGKVTDGMDVVDAIKRGTGPNGAVVGQPDVMTKVTVTE